MSDRSDARSRRPRRRRPAAGPGDQPPSRQPRAREPLGGASQSEQHFDPLPRDWQDAADEITASFQAPRALSSEERALLTRFVHLCLRFAYMETRVQGEILCEIPTHLDALRGAEAQGSTPNGETAGTGCDPEAIGAQAAALAEAERRNLDLDSQPIEDLADLLDTRGIKTIEWPGWNGERAGAFLFDPRTGPALLALAPPGSRSARYMLAHQYGHLLADVDPYVNRFCLHGTRAGAGHRTCMGGRIADRPQLEAVRDDAWEACELRADLFARALLLPERHFLETARAFEAQPERQIDLERIGHLAYYYGVEPAVILHRFVDLGLLPADEDRALMPPEGCPPAFERFAAGDEEPLPYSEELPPGLPRRFVNLDLALYLKRSVSLEQFAVLLGIEPDQARRFLVACEPPPPEAGSQLPPELAQLFARPEE